MPDRTATPAETVQALVAAIAVKDFDTALQYIAEDCEYQNPPPIGTMRGPAGVRAVLEPFFAPTIENEFVVRQQFVSGPLVFIERVDRHHLPDKWVEVPVAGVFEVHDGLITAWRDYFDVGSVMSQWPAPAAAS